MEGEEKHFLDVVEKIYAERKPVFFSVFGTLAAFVLFSAVAFAERPIPFTQYFLSVGQGDSEAVILHGGAVALIDGGPPNGRVLRELEKILPFYKRSIDVVVLTHPEEDHFGGLIELLKRFKVGAVITNGDANETEAYFEFMKTTEQENIKTITLSAGDKIRQGDITFSVLWPSDPAEGRPFSDKRNDNALVLLGEFRGHRSLFTGDISDKVEKELASRIPSAALLKVAHHGSKYSSDAGFLSALAPAAAVIGVGQNRYGHPAPEAVSRLEAAGAEVFRTDRDGTLGARFEGNLLKIFHVK